MSVSKRGTSNKFEKVTNLNHSINKLSGHISGGNDIYCRECFNYKINIQNTAATEEEPKVCSFKSVVGELSFVVDQLIQWKTAEEIEDIIVQLRIRNFLQKVKTQFPSKKEMSQYLEQNYVNSYLIKRCVEFIYGAGSSDKVDPSESRFPLLNRRTPLWNSVPVKTIVNVRNDH